MMGLAYCYYYYYFISLFQQVFFVCFCYLYVVVDDYNLDFYFISIWFVLGDSFSIGIFFRGGGNGGRIFL